MQQVLFAAALHHAAEGGHLEVVAKLVIAGCNVSRYDHQGMSPGHLAARHGYHRILDKLLLAGYALDMQGGLTALHGSVGVTALHIAACHGHLQVRQHVMHLNNIDIICRNNFACPLINLICFRPNFLAWLCGRHGGSRFTPFWAYQHVSDCVTDMHMSQACMA